MDNLLTLAFEAHHAQKNHHRRYEMVLGRDLFDAWTVTVRFGRTGRGGQERRYALSEVHATRALIRDRLRRRLSAPRRIGCAYQLAVFSHAPGFEAADWLPGDIIGLFPSLGSSRVALPSAAARPSGTTADPTGDAGPSMTLSGSP